MNRIFFFEEAKMNYITTAKKAFLAQGVLGKNNVNPEYKQ